MIILSKEQIIAIHDTLIDDTGGSYGIRDIGLLESALSAPFQTFDKAELYPTLYEKAARLGYGLVENHAFLDGNKRIAAHTMLLFLTVNGIQLKYTQKELADLFLEAASGVKGYEAINNWIIQHLK